MELLEPRRLLATFQVSNLNDNGPGSLRQAILDANAGGDDEIEFVGAATSGTINLTNGPLYINPTGDLTIIGPGADALRVDAGGQFPVVRTNSTGAFDVEISGLTISGGQVNGDGGGVFFNFNGTLTISDSVIEQNTAAAEGGGIRLGAASNSLIVERSTIRDNTAGVGGGISADQVTIRNSTLTGNLANSRGGGVFNYNGPLSIESSTISGNLARAEGGGVWKGQGSFNLSSSTVTGNQGLYQNSNNPNVGGGLMITVTSAILHNNIVAGNVAGTAELPSDITGVTINSGSSFNLIGNASTSAGLTHGVNNNIVGNAGSGVIDINTVLDTTLGDNGGPTATHALVVGSQAIDAGFNITGATTDQRGGAFSRLIDDPAIAAPAGGDETDMGAYESSFIAVVTTLDDTVDGNDGLLSLREAIALTNSGASNSIAFDPSFSTGGPHTIQLASSELLITSDVNIVGPGPRQLTIVAATDERIINVDDSLATFIEVEISGLTLTGGNTSGSGGAVRSQEHTTLRNLYLVGNAADDGGAVFTTSGGTMTIIDSTLSDNEAAINGSSDGGAIYNNSTNGRLTVVNSTLSGNRANGVGGAIANGGSSPNVWIQSSTITGNVAGNDGGGIRKAGGPYRLFNTILAGNFANGVPNEVAGPLTSSSSFNLIGSADSSGGLTHGTNGNIVGNGGSGTIDINTVLNPNLADNGGSTPTHALVAGSPAIDGGQPAFSPAAVLADNPVAYWRLGDNPTGPAVNLGSIGSAVDGTFEGSPSSASDLATGQNDGAIAFDGVNDAIAIPSHPLINTSTIPSRTIELYFNAGDVNTQQMLYEEGGNVQGFNIYLDSGRIVLGAWENGGANFAAFLNTPVSSGTTYHVALVFDGPNESLIGYLDGQMFGQLTSSDIDGTIDPLNSHAGDIVIGAMGDSTRIDNDLNSNSGTGMDPGSVTLPFNGAIDELVLFNEALSDANIAAHLAGISGTLDQTGYLRSSGTLDDIGSVEYFLALDFGDASAGYPTTLAEDGARHVVTGPSLGAGRDLEREGIHSAAADADGADDDGVTLVPLAQADIGATFTVNVQNAASGAFLDAWIDFNADGMWSAGEQIATSLAVSEGDNDVTFDVPHDAAVGDTFARFRLSSAGGHAPTGLADDGEVEDYQLTIAQGQFDFGDAPSSYPTTLAEGGARHATTGPTLGASRDGELDGIHSAAADADGADEDGVSVVPLTQADTGAMFTVNVQNAPSGALLDAWIDFNSDGTWSAGEQIAANLAVTEGNNDLTFAVPYDAAVGDTYARFRLSTTGNQSPTGFAFDGEVEDYQVTINQGEFDFGDARAPFPTTLAQNGAYHRGVGPQLGAQRDVELNGTSSSGASSDDLDNLDDEDGVIFNRVILGQTGEITIDVRNAPAGAFLDAWIDFNDNGNWAANEQIFDNQPVVEGVTTLTFSVPGGPNLAVSARVRLSSQGDLDTTGFAADGEVEDYLVALETPVFPGHQQSIYVHGLNYAPAGLTIDPVTRNIYTADDGNSNGRLREIATDRTVTVITNDFTPNGTLYPYGNTGIQFVDGNVYVMNRNGFLTGIELTTGNSTLVENFNGYGDEAGITAIGNTLYFTSGTGSAREIGSYDLTTATTGTVDITPTNYSGPISYPAAIERNPVAGGNELFLSSLGGVQGLFQQTISGDTTRLTGFAGSGNFAVDPTGQYLFVRDGNVLRRVTVSTGQVIGLMGLNSNNGGQDLAFGPSSSGIGQSLYIADANRIREISGFGPYDLGDAPASYGTNFIDNGAHHVTYGPTLGVVRDDEADGQATTAADGDGTDDDGVTLVPITAGEQNVTFTINVGNAPAGALLDAWIDFDGNGVFDVSDRIANNLSVSEGDNDLTFNVPTSAALGDTYARFRLSTAGNLEPTGLAFDGEVEDYALTITADLGDAPAPYPTLFADNGPRHAAGGPVLGTAPDFETEGQPSAGADGDGADEDGVTIVPIVAGSEASFMINVANAPTGARLDAWIDFNADGTFGGGNELIADNLVVVEGQNLLTFSVPATALPGTTFARFRVSTTGNLNPDGPATDGEVEDYAVTVLADLGDAPAPYPTLVADDGARHAIGGPSLGVPPNYEPDGQPDATASADQFEEVGVVLSDLQAGQLGSAAVAVLGTSDTARLDAWIDFNQDGDWNDLGEQIFSSLLLTAGNHTLPFAVPTSATFGNTFARFRISSAGNLSPTGVALDGEVEDHLVTIRSDLVVDLTADPVTVRANGGDLEVVLTDSPTTVIASQALAFTNGLILQGNDNEANVVTIDYAAPGGFFSLPAGIDYRGDATASSSGDHLIIEGGFGTSASTTGAANSVSSGNLQMQQGSQFNQISYRLNDELSLLDMAHVELSGQFSIVDQTMTINALSFTSLADHTTITNGTLIAPGGLHLTTGDLLLASGTVTAPISSDRGSTINVIGDLTLGDAASLDGIDLQGRLNIGANTVTLLDGHKVVLGSQTTLGSGGSSGTLNAPTGVALEDNLTFSGQGEINTANGEFENQGFVLCGGTGITFNHLVVGAGDFGGSCTFLGDTSFGNSPAEIAGDDMAFGPQNNHVVELGGLIAGTEFDKVDAGGTVILDGTLDVRFIDLNNGYDPQAGDEFQVIVADSGMVGTFDSVSLPPLPAGLEWEVTYSANEVRLVIGTSGSVVNRVLFYHDSAFSAGSEDSAIADKVPFRAGETSTVANHSNYLHGINGLMIDIDGLPTPATLGVADFGFRVGRVSDTSTWTDLTIPPTIDVRSGDGLAGSTRVVLTWPNSTIINTWLEVMVRPTANTGLAEADVFYFGNQIGDVSGEGEVNGTDFIAVRANPATFLTPATVNNPFDMNHDGRVNSADMLIVRDHATILGEGLPRITPNGAAFQSFLAAANLTTSSEPGYFILREPTLDSAKEQGAVENVASQGEPSPISTSDEDTVRIAALYALADQLSKQGATQSDDSWMTTQHQESMESIIDLLVADSDEVSTEGRRWS